jgi:hypothetical protein
LLEFYSVTHDARKHATQKKYTQQILLEFNAAIWFSKDCKLYNFTTHYVQTIFLL